MGISERKYKLYHTKLLELSVDEMLFLEQIEKEVLNCFKYHTPSFIRVCDKIFFETKNGSIKINDAIKNLKHDINYINAVLDGN